MTNKAVLNQSTKQRGAVEACWAHNSEVGGSKPFAAMYFFIDFIKIKLIKNKAFNLLKNV
jgi:hypothetical protein